ncbi:MAG: cyanophycinase [Rhodoferax sp.]|nr:MAG: cyanophycinase [Rhodoferax sp.]
MVSRRQWLQALASLAAGSAWTQAWAQAKQGARKTGHLVIVGGAEDRVHDRLVLRRFLELSGGPLARILVCTAASGDPEGSWKGYAPVFADMGAQNVQHLSILSSSDANQPAVAEQILAADGIFLTGGDQRRLMERLWETQAARAIHLAFHVQGCTLGGTSAGAAVMSRAMLAIGEATRRPQMDTITLDIGLGLLSNAIVDQHFNERYRLGRLLSALALRKDLLGVGIDEDTALVVERNKAIEVVGSGNVTIVDGRRMRTNSQELQAHDRLEMMDVRLHVLPAGNRYSVAPAAAQDGASPQRTPSAFLETLKLLVEPGPIRG